MIIDPSEKFHGTIMIAVPHMDDGVLACGGTIAKLPNKEKIHIVYATDGMASPSPVLPWRGSLSNDLGSVRINEARSAMEALGIPEENLYFLNLPDSGLKKNSEQLKLHISQLLEQIRPEHVFVPFRYDCHLDHLALHFAVTALLSTNLFDAECHEYFVYYRYRLLPKRDVRKYIIPKFLCEVDITDVSQSKRAALDCFKSQTTTYYPWQRRPNLLPWVLDESSQTPEVFLRYYASLPGAAVFKNYGGWIRLIHTMEPFMKKKKDQAQALFQLGITRNARIAN